jgi:hypothetical protein
MYDATRPPAEKVVFDRATGKTVTVREDPAAPVRFTAEVEKDFFGRMAQQGVKKEQRLKVGYHNMSVYGCVWVCMGVMGGDIGSSCCVCV